MLAAYFLLCSPEPVPQHDDDDDDVLYFLSIVSPDQNQDADTSRVHHPQRLFPPDAALLANLHDQLNT